MPFFPPSPKSAVTSVAGKTGAIVLAESDITNLTSDLSTKLPISGGTITGSINLSGYNVSNVGLLTTVSESITLPGTLPVSGLTLAMPANKTATLASGVWVGVAGSPAHTTVTMTTTATHNFVVGDVVSISGYTFTSVFSSRINNTWTITAVTSNTFTYVISGVNYSHASANVATAGYCGTKQATSYPLKVTDSSGNVLASVNGYGGAVFSGDANQYINFIDPVLSLINLQSSTTNAVMLKSADGLSTVSIGIGGLSSNSPTYGFSFNHSQNVTFSAPGVTFNSTGGDVDFTASNSGAGTANIHFYQSSSTTNVVDFTGCNTFSFGGPTVNMGYGSGGGGTLNMDGGGIVNAAYVAAEGVLQGQYITLYDTWDAGGSSLPGGQGGDLRWFSTACNPGESSGAGTGCHGAYNNGQWCYVSTNTPITF